MVWAASPAASIQRQPPEDSTSAPRSIRRWATRIRAGGKKEETTVRSARPAACTASTQGPAMSLWARLSTLISRFTRKSGGISASHSASVGMRAPVSGRPRCRATRSSVSVRSTSSGVSTTDPRWPVQRASVQSWNTTSSPDAHLCTSNSTPSAPASRASRSASRLFSGARREAPRCAITMGRPSPFAQRLLIDLPIARGARASDRAPPSVTPDPAAICRSI